MAHYTKDIEKHTKKGQIPLIVLLCSLVYLVSYLGRLSFASVAVEMIQSEGFDKTLIAIPMTGLSVTYGFGQLISGYLGDKVSPEKMIFTGLLISAGMNFAIPFTSSSVAVMTVIWCINGFAQAMMWPPIVKILTARLSPEEYHKNVVYIGWGSSVGTIVIYLFAPVAIAVASWKFVFFFAALCALSLAVVWICTVYRAEALVGKEGFERSAAPTGKPEPFHGFAALLLAVIFFSIALQGILRDGIANWMPTYITEVFKVDSTVSILTGIALPIFSMFIMWFSAFVYRKLIRNESLCSALFFGLCGISLAILSFASAASAVLSVVCLMVANAATHGVNMMYTSLVVPNFARYGKTSFVTGLINSASYVGSAVSTYGVALVSEKFGWNGTMAALLVVSVLGVVFAFFSVPYLKKLKNLNKNY